MKKETITKLIAIAVLIALALTSIFVLSDIATDAANYQHTIEAIDDKKATVMAFTATAATASTAIAAIPGDASTPIANQIMEISEYLFIVVCFLVLEKSLLTVMGYFSCNILIPAACILLIIDQLAQKNWMKVLAAKLAIFAAAIVLIIPLSVEISDMIYDVNQSTVEQISAVVEESTPTEPTEEAAAEDEEEKSWWESLGETVSDSWNSAVENVENAVENTGEAAEDVLNKFIDAIALFIIAYCAIPVIVVLVVVWLIKFLFQISIPIEKITPRNLFHRKKSGTDTAALQEV